MSEYSNYIEKIEDIALRHNIDIKLQLDVFNFIEQYSATLPIIGAFNTGKSSAINAMIGQQLLPTGIVPQPCPPVEICYGENRLSLCRDDVVNVVDLNYLREKNPDLNGVKAAKLYCNNSFFNSIKDITLVDLPGYDSGTQQHERWVREYLFNSYNFLLIVAADEPIIKYSFIQLLSSYTSKERPLFLLITKCDKIPVQEVQKCRVYLENTIKEYLPVKEVHTALMNEDHKELNVLFKYINKYLKNEKTQMITAQTLYICSYINTVLSNEVLIENLPMPERRRLLERHELQLNNLINTNKTSITELAKGVKSEIKQAQKRIAEYVEELVEPIWMLATSSQNVVAFINSIVPAYVNKEVYSNIHPLFSSHQKRVNSLLSLYEITNEYNETKEEDISSAVFEEMLKGEQSFIDELLPPISKISRRIKKQDGEIIIREFILVNIAEAIYSWMQTGLNNYLNNYIETVLQQIELAKSIKERIANNVDKQGALGDEDRQGHVTRLKADLLNIQYIINYCTELKENE